MKEKILIVDDEPNICHAIERVLQLDEYQTQTANSGKEAMAKIKSCRPDLILLDITMPEMNGLEVCRALREDEFSTTIPIIMVTAKYEEEIIAAALESGADDYIIKPFESKELQEQIRHTLSRLQQGLLSCQLKHDLKLLREKLKKEPAQDK